MSPDTAAALTRFVLLEGFFPLCRLPRAQLRQRSSPAFSLGSVRAAVEDAFARPGGVHVKPSGPCEVCQKPRHCIRGQDSRMGSAIAMSIGLGTSLLLAVMGVVVWIEGGPRPRTPAAWVLLMALPWTSES